MREGSGRQARAGRKFPSGGPNYHGNYSLMFLSIAAYASVQPRGSRPTLRGCVCVTDRKRDRESETERERGERRERRREGESEWR